MFPMSKYKNHMPVVESAMAQNHVVRSQINSSMKCMKLYISIYIYYALLSRDNDIPGRVTEV